VSATSSFAGRRAELGQGNLRRGAEPRRRSGRPTHDLRHTLIGLAFDNGLTLPEASVLARHANSRVTSQVYAGVSDKAREQITEKLAAAGFGT
jgi:integrase